ncbi:putative peptidase (DUF1758) [Popillia japonica]|uniref:Peptidase (DUF1758) n=1 Tax=Popillia japonica TaxID=7064 RepID=A0AAW1IEA0_POPJA
MLDFLSRKCSTLEAVFKNSSSPSHHIKFSKHPKAALSHISRQEIHCGLCKDNHFIYQCSKFLNMSVEERTNQVKAAKLCLNCLRSGHTSKNCNSSHCRKCNSKHNTLLHQTEHKTSSPKVSGSDDYCRKCNSKHNTLLHQTEHKTSSPKVSGSDDCEAKPGSSTMISAHFSNFDKSTQVLLSTAMVGISDREGRFHKCRVLLDSGSQSNFISTALVKKLQLKEIPVNIPVSGISQAFTRIKTAISASIKSNHNEFNTTLRCLVLENITNDIPAVVIDRAQLEIPKNIQSN